MRISDWSSDVCSSDLEIDAITRGMWDNLGRSAAECVHIEQLARTACPGGRIEIVGLEHVVRMRDDGKPGMIVSGHIGNWELCGPGRKSAVEGKGVSVRVGLGGGRRNKK